MKRIMLFSSTGEKLFSGNQNDLPLDDSEVNKTAYNRFGENLCPQRYATVKQTILVGIYENNNNSEVIIPADYKHYLKHKNAYKIIIYND